MSAFGILLAVEFAIAIKTVIDLIIIEKNERGFAIAYDLIIWLCIIAAMANI